jgi:hypothetical protein
MVARVEKILSEGGQGHDFIERVLKREYLEARDRILSSNDPSLLQFQSQFASVDLSTEPNYSSCIDNIVLAGAVENGGHDFFDYQDSVSHISCLFNKHLMASILK